MGAYFTEGFTPVKLTLKKKKGKTDGKLFMDYWGLPFCGPHCRVTICFCFCFFSTRRLPNVSRSFQNSIAFYENICVYSHVSLFCQFYFIM